METKTVEIIEGKYGEGQCANCRHVGDDVDLCILRRCVNAVHTLKQAYEPRNEDEAAGVEEEDHGND